MKQVSLTTGEAIETRDQFGRLTIEGAKQVSACLALFNRMGNAKSTWVRVKGKDVIVTRQEVEKYYKTI